MAEVCQVPVKRTSGLNVIYIYMHFEADDDNVIRTTNDNDLFRIPKFLSIYRELREFFSVRWLIKSKLD